MIRILFILLALVAAGLAALLKQPSLYGVAGLLLLAALALVVSGLRPRPKRQPRGHDEPAAPAPLGAPREDDLNALGILEIRPKGGRPQPPAPTEAGAEASTGAEAPPPAPERPHTERNGTKAAEAPRVLVKEKSPSVHAIDTVPDAPYASMMLPYLQALRAALDAQTVCLLQQSEPALAYHIEGIVSQNAYARSGGSFKTTVPLLNASEARRPVTVRRVGEHGIPQGSLGYYRDVIAVRQVAMAPVPVPGSTSMYFLLADTMQEGALGTKHHRNVLAEFAHLLGTVMDAPNQDGPFDEEEQVRPRRDIIAEEMEKARAQRRDLALSLVYLNEAEPRADEGPEAVAAAEQALEAYLREATTQGRIERFGELTFGVFYTGNVSDVETWAMDLQHALSDAEGPLQGGISVGIAILQDRHRDPDAFRADATAALREAYETGTCTIVE